MAKAITDHGAGARVLFVVSGSLGVPITLLKAGQKNIDGRSITVNQSKLDKQVFNIKDLAKNIK